MKKDEINLPSSFNQFYNELDEIYHLYAKNHNLSDTALWLLYALHENDVAYTQRQLCTAWHCPPQTLNSALKNLKKQGCIVLKSSQENHKNKLIVLTEKGKEKKKKIISPLILAEQRTFQQLTENEREALLSLTEKYIKILWSEINSI